MASREPVAKPRWRCGGRQPSSTTADSRAAESPHSALTEAQTTEKGRLVHAQGADPKIGPAPRTWARDSRADSALGLPSMPERDAQGGEVETKTDHSGHPRWPPGSLPVPQRSPQASHEGGDHHDVRNAEGKAWGPRCSTRRGRLSSRIRISGPVEGLGFAGLSPASDQPEPGPPGPWSTSLESRPSTRQTKQNIAACSKAFAVAARSRPWNLSRWVLDPPAGLPRLLRVDGARLDILNGRHRVQVGPKNLGPRANR